jgi:transcriptional regulator with XRE-family HTH domain
MKLTGRKIQVWRKRLNIKQADLAAYVCITKQQLQLIENQQRVPDRDEIIGFLNTALLYFEKTSMQDIVVDAARRNTCTHGFIAGLQTLTDTDTTTDFYRAKKEQAMAHMRIADSLRFYKGPLPEEKLCTVYFDSGRNLDIWGRPFSIMRHVAKFYPERKAMQLVLNNEAA